MNGYNGWIDSLNTIECSVRFFPFTACPHSDGRLCYFLMLFRFHGKVPLQSMGYKGFAVTQKYIIYVYGGHRQSEKSLRPPSRQRHTHTHEKTINAEI